MSGGAEKTDDSPERISFLAEQIAHHSNLYYNLAQPEISDAEFDRLWDELNQIDPQHPQLSRVGADLAPGSVKVDHLKMLVKRMSSMTIDLASMKVSAWDGRRDRGLAEAWFKASSHRTIGDLATQAERASSNGLHLWVEDSDVESLCAGFEGLFDRRAGAPAI